MVRQIKPLLYVLAGLTAFWGVALTMLVSAVAELLSH